jgi:hypothetical protein
VQQQELQDAKRRNLAEAGLGLKVPSMHELPNATLQQVLKLLHVKQ